MLRIIRKCMVRTLFAYVRKDTVFFKIDTTFVLQLHYYINFIIHLLEPKIALAILMIVRHLYD